MKIILLTDEQIGIVQQWNNSHNEMFIPCGSEFGTFIPLEINNELKNILGSYDIADSEIGKIWDYPEKPLRIKLSDSDIVQLFKDIPPFRDYIDTMSDTTVARNGNQCIYLSEVYEDHKALLSNYSSFSLDERK